MVEGDDSAARGRRGPPFRYRIQVFPPVPVPAALVPARTRVERDPEHLNVALEKACRHGSAV